MAEKASSDGPDVPQVPVGDGSRQRPGVRIDRRPAPAGRRASAGSLPTPSADPGLGSITARQPRHRSLDYRVVITPDYELSRTVRSRTQRLDVNAPEPLRERLAQEKRPVARRAARDGQRTVSWEVV